MFKQLNNERGLVFVIILMVVIVMITLTLSLISINISQVNLTEKEAQRMQSDLIGPALLSLAFTGMQSEINNPGDTITLPTTTIDGITYTAKVQILPPSPDPMRPSLLNAIVDF